MILGSQVLERDADSFPTSLEVLVQQRTSLGSCSRELPWRRQWPRAIRGTRPLATPECRATPSDSGCTRRRGQGAGQLSLREGSCSRQSRSQAGCSSSPHLQTEGEEPGNGSRRDEACTRVSTHVCVHAHARTRRCMCTCVHVCTYRYVHVCASMHYVHLCVHVCTCVCLCLCVHAACMCGGIIIIPAFR